MAEVKIERADFHGEWNYLPSFAWGVFFLAHAFAILPLRHHCAETIASILSPT